MIANLSRRSDLLLLACLLVLPAAGWAQAAKARTISLGYGLSEDSVQGRAVKVFAQELARLSKGRLVVKGSADGKLGDDRKMQQAVAAGKQDMLVCSSATLVDTAKEMGIWDAPFLFFTTEEADTVLDGAVGQKVLDKLLDKGLVGLVYGENGFRQMTNNVRPIIKLEDLAGLKLRVMQNPIYADAFQTLGASTVPLPYTELLPALQARKVDGQENPFSTILSSKMYDSQKYLTATKHVYSPWVLLASRKFWDSLSADDQKDLVDAAKISREAQRKDSRELAGKALAALKAKGMEFNNLSLIEAGRMRFKLKPVNEKVAAQVGQQIWEEVQGELTRLRR